MRGAIAAAACACLCAGCEPDSLPTPRVLSIEPNQMVSSETANVAITVDAVLPFELDYATRKVTVHDSIILSVGNYLLATNKYVSGGVLPGYIPSRLAPGVHDVTMIILDDQRVGTLAGAFTVTPGRWPTGYTIDMIMGPKQALVPFEITIRATGPEAPSFRGTVDLSDLQRGLVAPVPTGAFAGGVRTETVTVPITASGLILVVTDLQGTTGMSNPFNVN